MASLAQQALRLASTSSVRLYSTLQVARRLGLSSMALMRWIVAGKIPCPKRFRIDSNQTLQWLWDEKEIARAATFWNDARRFTARRRNITGGVSRNGTQ